MSSKQVLDPYKTIGCFVNGPLCVSQSQPFSFAVGCYNSFKIYSDELAIKMVSPCFESPVRALHNYNEFTYVVIGNSLIKIKYQHIVRKWELPTIKTNKNKSNKQEQERVSMLVFDGVIMISIGSHIHIIP